MSEERRATLSRMLANLSRGSDDLSGRAKLRSGISSHFALDLIYGGRKEFYMRSHFEDEGIWHKTTNRDKEPYPDVFKAASEGKL